MTMISPSLAHDYLHEFARDLPEGAWLYVWTVDAKTKKKTTHWCNSIDAAIKVADRLGKTADVYIGMAWADRAGKTSQRVWAELPKNPTEKEQNDPSPLAAGIFGVWADIDLDVPGHHKKGNLPSSIDEVLDVLAHIPAPTICVLSGGGAHLYWLFDEAWHVTDDNRVSVQRYLEGWNKTIAAAMQKQGWQCDSTQDLARVLRVPGTLNHKTDPAKATALIVNEDGTRYNRHQLADFIDFDLLTPQPKERAPRASSASSDAPTSSGVLLLNENADPPFSKFMAISANDAKFTKTWNRKRTLKDMSDTSASGYEMALADAAISAGWTDQETCDLLIAWRRQHGETPVLKTEHYFQRTIDTAHALHDKNEAPDLASDDDDDEDRPFTDEDRAKLLTWLNMRMNVKIVRIIKYMSDPPLYRLETKSGEIILGEVQNLINQTQLRNKVAAAASRIIPKFSTKEWETISQALLKVCTIEEMSEATYRGRMESIMSAYIGDRSLAPDIESADPTRSPFHHKDGKSGEEMVCFYFDHFESWLSLNRPHSAPELSQLSAMMRLSGVKPKIVRLVPPSGNPTSRSVFVVPKWAEPHGGDDE